MTNANSIVMLGATGAVGNHTAQTLSRLSTVECLTLLGRRPSTNVEGNNVSQHQVDVFSTESYKALLQNHTTAICTLGVGQPSKMSKEEFVKIDKDVVIDFATECKKAGIRHFQLLSSVGVSPSSSSFFLRTKGELEDCLKALNFEQLSLFHPSMIITPTNRYGLSQAITLAVMPYIDPLLIGSMRKFRSIPVETLGVAIALNSVAAHHSSNIEIFTWKEIVERSVKA